MTRNDPIYGRGWSFPVKPAVSAREALAGRPAAGGRMSYLSGEEKIRQALWILLSTAPGERQMRPDFGCGIHNLVGHPNSAALRAAVRDQIMTALVKWEPRIDTLDVRVETDPSARNYLVIRIDYRVRSNNAAFNLVYPFFLTEGNA